MFLSLDSAPFGRACSVLEVGGEAGTIKAVQNALLRDAPLSRHFDAPMCKRNLIRIMRVGIDAHETSERERALVPAPVQIEPPRICIDLDSHAMRGAGE